MKIDQFEKAAPGKLVPTQAFESRVRNGLLEAVRVPTQAFVPDPLPPALDWKRLFGDILPELLDAQDALARLDTRAQEVEPRLLMGPFWRREARLSSLIEDTNTTPEKLAVAEATQAPQEESEREVSNYLKALAFGRGSPLPICNRLIREMHMLLLHNVRGERDQPGRFRTEQNYIGNEALGVGHARFVPPPPGEVERCMAELERFINDTARELPALITIPLVHYQFECIHPFRDGNGRLGRVLIMLSLMRTGLLKEPWIYVSDYLEKNRADYRDLLLRVSTNGDWQAWLRFMLQGLATAARDAAQAADRILALRDELRSQVTSPRSSALLLKVVDRLFEKPVITVKDACELLDVSHTAVRRHIRRLTSIGILEPLDLGSREQFWIARRILDVSESNS